MWIENNTHESCFEATVHTYKYINSSNSLNWAPNSSDTMCGLITGRRAVVPSLIQMINTICSHNFFSSTLFLKEILFTAEKEIMQPGSITSSLGRLSESKCQTSQKKSEHQRSQVSI